MTPEPKGKLDGMATLGSAPIAALPFSSSGVAVLNGPEDDVLD